MTDISMKPSRVMRALIIDDEPAVRKYLHGILKKKFQVEVFEAENGVQGLEMIETSSPDFIVLDLMMPILNGKETLSAIRSDKNFMHLPVIILTAVKDKTTFRELITVGISDYILKPVDYEFAVNRFQIVISELKNSLSKSGSKGSVMPSTVQSDSKLLVIDQDVNFTRFVNDVMGRRFTVIEAGSGAAGLTEFAKHRPKITLIGENLPLLNEKLLAKKIRAIASENYKLVMLCENRADMDNVPPEFDSMLQKSFVPDAFLKNFTQIAVDGKHKPLSYEEMVAEYMPSEVFNATHQAFGILAGIEVSIVADDDVIEKQTFLYANTVLQSNEDKAIFKVMINCNEADASWLSASILGVINPGREEQLQVLQDLINTIAGRLRTAFEIYGVLLQERTDMMSSGIETEGRTEQDLSLAFRSSSKQTYRLSIKVEQ